MDYIREELLRQQAGLARLLLGQEKRGAETADEGTEAQPAEEAADLRRQAELFDAQRRLFAGERRPESFAPQTANGAGEGFGRSKREGFPAAHRQSGPWEKTPATLWTDGNRGSFWEVPRSGEMTGPETGAPLAGGSAEELSRAFQRDARRYDGGFTLY